MITCLRGSVQCRVTVRAESPGAHRARRSFWRGASTLFADARDPVPVSRECNLHRLFERSALETPNDDWELIRLRLEPERHAMQAHGRTSSLQVGCDAHRRPSVESRVDALRGTDDDARTGHRRRPRRRRRSGDGIRSRARAGRDQGTGVDDDSHRCERENSPTTGPDRRRDRDESARRADERERGEDADLGPELGRCRCDQKRRDQRHRYAECDPLPSARREPSADL